MFFTLGCAQGGAGGEKLLQMTVDERINEQDNNADDGGEGQ